MDGEAVSVRHASVARDGLAVLRQVNFTISTGVVAGLIGPSGSGKTTLMRAIVGLQQIGSGQIDVLGLPAGSSALRDRLGYMAQTPSVYEDLTVMQNIRYFARVLGYPREEADRVIREVALRPQRAQLVGTLSGGQRARVSLAVALLGRPALLVLDEPTVGLDPVLRESLWTLFQDLAAAGTTLIISSHVMDEAARCQQLLLIRAGRLIANDSVSNILALTGTADINAAFLKLVGYQG